MFITALAISAAFPLTQSSAKRAEWLQSIFCGTVFSDYVKCTQYAGFCSYFEKTNIPSKLFVWQINIPLTFPFTSNHVYSDHGWFFVSK